MKYIVFCYNTPTLCRTIRYVNSIWGIENTSIIYANLVSDIPQNIVRDYHIELVETNHVDKKRGFQLIIQSCLVTNQISKVVLEKKKNIHEDTTLIVFRDNEIEEATIIRRMKKYFPQTKITLIEEGSGIYALSRIEPRFKLLKKIIYKCFGIGSYSLTSNPQGLNKDVSCIICSNPESITTKVCQGVNIEQIIAIFTYELNDYITKSFFKNNESEDKYDFVFLTQPLTDFREDYEKLIRVHSDLLPKIFKILSKYGKTIIKLHPRETYNYDKYINDRVNISSKEEAEIPFECLLQHYGNPQMISMFSSASISIQTEKSSLYLYKLFSIPGVDGLYEESHLKNNNIIVCESIEDIEKNLYSVKKEKEN